MTYLLRFLVQWSYIIVPLVWIAANVMVLEAFDYEYTFFHGLVIGAYAGVYFKELKEN